MKRPEDELVGALTMPHSGIEDEIGFHQGKVIAFNLDTGENTIRIKDTDFFDLPVMNVTDSAGLVPGMVVGVLRIRSTYFVIGRIANPGSAQFGDLTVRSSDGSSITFEFGRISIAHGATVWPGRVLASVDFTEEGEKLPTIIVIAPTDSPFASGASLYMRGEAVGGALGFANLQSSGEVQVNAGTDIQLTAGTSVRLQGGVGTQLITAPTTTATANMQLNGLGSYIRYITSARRFKLDIADFDPDPFDVLKLRPRTWRDKSEVEENPDTEHRIAGFVAEEVAEIPGLEPLVVRDAEGEPEALAYDRFPAALLSVLRQQQQQIDELTAQLAALKADHDGMRE